MVVIQAHGWQQFLTAFGVLRAAGVEPIASGGNGMRVPDDTDRQVLCAVAATGAAVHADLTGPVAAEPTSEPSDGKPDTDVDVATEPKPNELAPTPVAPPPSDENPPDGADDEKPAAPVKRTPRKATRTRRTRNTAEE